MDFDFTDDQVSLRDAVQRWVDKGFGFERRHAHRQGRRRHARGLRRTGRARPDRPGRAARARRHGLRRGRGDGGDGRTRPRPRQRALCRCRADGAVAAAAAPAAVQAAWLPKIADGSALVVPALQERAARYRWQHVETRAARSRRQLAPERRQEPGAGRRRGRRLRRAGAHRGRRRSREGIGLFLVERGADGAAVRGYPTQDGARAAELTLSATPATLISADGADALERAHRHRHRRDLRRGGRPDGPAGGDHRRLHEHAQAVRRADRQLPGPAPPHGRREDAARARPLDELLRQPQARRAGGRSAAAR